MNYVYKIVGDFENMDFEKALDKLSTKFKIMYVDGTLFLAVKSWKEYEGSNELIKKVLVPAKNFYIQEMDQKHLDRQQSYIKEWGQTQSVKLDRERYEAENQEHLKQAWASMDELEEKLKQIAEENERKEESDGKSNNKG